MLNAIIESFSVVLLAILLLGVLGFFSGMFIHGVIHIYLRCRFLNLSWIETILRTAGLAILLGLIVGVTLTTVVNFYYPRGSESVFRAQIAQSNTPLSRWIFLSLAGGALGLFIGLKLGKKFMLAFMYDEDLSTIRYEEIKKQKEIRTEREPYLEARGDPDLSALFSTAGAAEDLPGDKEEREKQGQVMDIRWRCLVPPQRKSQGRFRSVRHLELATELEPIEKTTPEDSNFPQALPVEAWPAEGFPRQSTSLNERAKKSQKDIARQKIFGAVKGIYSYESLVRDRPTSIPFITGIDGRALTLVKLSVSSEGEHRQVVQALERQKTRFEVGFFLSPAYPVFRVVLRIFDRRFSPLVLESFTDIVEGDVQDFIQVLSSTRLWQLVVYTTPPLRLAGMVENEISIEDAKWIHDLWSAAKHHYYRIENKNRNYPAAVEWLTSQVPIGSWQVSGQGAGLMPLNLYPRRNDVVIIKDEEYGPVILPRQPNILAEINTAEGLSEKTKKIICLLQHPEDPVREEMLQLIYEHQVEDIRIGPLNEIIFRLVDPSESVRSLAAKILWQRGSVDHAVDVFRNEYYQQSIFGTHGLYLTPAEALRALYKLREEAPTPHDRQILKQLVKEKIQIELE